MLICGCWPSAIGDCWAFGRWGLWGLGSRDCVAEPATLVVIADRVFLPLALSARNQSSRKSTNYASQKSGANLALFGRMNPKAEALVARTHEFLMRAIKFCDTLPQHTAAARFKGQLLDAAGGVESNYRAACRARSGREFVAKIGVAAEEADECTGWLKTLREASCGDRTEAAALEQEAIELTKIFTASQKTARWNQQSQSDPSRRARR
jgi:four helix bundle protein